MSGVAHPAVIRKSASKDKLTVIKIPNIEIKHPIIKDVSIKKYKKMYSMTP